MCPTPTGLSMASSGVPIRTRIFWRALYCRKWNAVRVCHAHHATQNPDSIATFEIVTFEQVIEDSGHSDVLGDTGGQCEVLQFHIRHGRILVQALQLQLVTERQGVALSCAKASYSL